MKFYLLSAAGLLFAAALPSRWQTSSRKAIKIAEMFGVASLMGRIIYAELLRSSGPGKLLTFLSFFLGNSIQMGIVAATLVPSMWGKELRECG